MKIIKIMNDVRYSVNKFVQDMDGKHLEIIGRKFNFLQIGFIVAVALELIAGFLPFIEGSSTIGEVRISGTSSYFSSGSYHIITLMILLISMNTLFFSRIKQFSILPAIYHFAWIVHDSLFSLGKVRDYNTLRVGAYIMMVASLAALIVTVLAYINENKRVTL